MTFVETFLAGAPLDPLTFLVVIGLGAIALLFLTGGE